MEKYIKLKNMIGKNNMIDNYMLYKNLPTIDLHGEDRITAVMKTKEFINDNIKLKNKLIIVIHGIGQGILKTAIHNYLKHEKKVVAYKLDIFNKGMTIIELV